MNLHVSLFDHLCVAGAGVGKTRLVHDLADDVLAGGGLPLIGRCYEFEQALAYQAIVEALRAAGQLLRHSELADAHRATLARLIPELQRRASDGKDSRLRQPRQG